MMEGERPQPLLSLLLLLCKHTQTLLSKLNPFSLTFPSSSSSSLAEERKEKALKNLRPKMMQEKVDLGLRLSLHPSQNPFPLPSFTHPPSPFSLYQKRQWNNLLPSSVEEAQPMLKGIDVNRKPGAESVLEGEEEEGASSPDSTLSSVSGKRSERDSFSSGVVHGLGRTSSRGVSDEEDGEGSRKKLRLSKEQSAVLEECFKEHNTLNPKQKIALAKLLNLRPRQVEVWFQNRRARTKLKQTEVDCEYLKRWSERLTQENRRLQKQAAELRALKLLSPMQMPVNMMPPATLTMCPSCQRVISSSNSSNSSSSTTTTATSSSPPANHQHHHFFPAAACSNPSPCALAPFGAAYLNHSS